MLGGQFFIVPSSLALVRIVMLSFDGISCSRHGKCGVTAAAAIKALSLSFVVYFVLGDTFTPTMTLNASLVNGHTLVQGGTVYGGPDPITAALTINGVTETINDSSDGFYFDLGNGTMEAYLQAFNYLNALQSPGLFSDLTTNVPVVANLGAPLPSMLLSNGDFANKDAAFSDGSNGENLDLTVQAVNVPEPSTLSSLVAGLTAGALLLRPPAA